MNGKARILVVDDERLITTMLKDVLEANGYEVLVASDGQEGLNQARAERPDLIILDVMMPKLDGFKVARLLKFDRNFQHIPIIMLTAKAGEHDAQTSKMSGADLYLLKPVEPKQLLEKITSLLGKT
ncbi:MAG: response regulator [candidate division NC10 bacterium]|nr:response regulator [candidate division NC10 bacterium]